MGDVPTPWVGLLAVSAMFWLPPLLRWLERLDRPVPPGHSEAFHRHGKLSCPPCEDPSWVEVQVPVEVVRLDEPPVRALERPRRQVRR